MRWSICISESQRLLGVQFFRTYSRLWIYHLFVWSNLIFLHNFQRITFPTQSFLVLYSFWDYLLYSLIIWLIVSSLSPHNLLLLFRCILSIFAFSLSSWLRFVLLSEEIQFLSYGFPYFLGLLILFSIYCCSFDPCVVCIVFGLFIFI